MNIPLFQFPPSLESEVATRGHAQTYPQMQHHYDDPGAFPPFSQASDDAPHLVHTRHPHPYGMNTHFSGGAPFRHVASDPAGGPSSRASEVDAYAPDDAPRYSAYDPTYGSSFASVPRALASPHVPQFSQDVRQREYVHASRPPPPEEQAVWSTGGYSTSTTAAVGVAVKHEEGEDAMAWADDDEQHSYTCPSEDAALPGEGSIEMDVHSPKREEVWDTQMCGMQADSLAVDTLMSQDYGVPYQPELYMFADSPVAMDYFDAPPMFSSPFVPLPTTSRSYTLEGAVSPISPSPQVAPPAPAPAHVPRPPSPPMGSLLPPSLPPQACVKLEADTAAVPPSPAPASTQPSSSASTSISAAPSAPTPPVVQKRPRGRPRKNPPSARPPSPPPVVDYPFPHFPNSGSSSSGPRPEDAIMPPMPHPLPTITSGTPGSVGPMPGAGGKLNATEVTGLPAGQAIFRLNMHKDGEGENADGREPEKKKPIMACLFCRERKIACGPPPPGGPRRCNQCTRRDLVCEYPKESRRGQHKRGTRAARVEALAAGSGSGSSAPATIKPKGKGKATDVRIDTSNLPSASSPSSHSMCADSPLTPVSPPAGATERPTRSEKVARAQGREGKERSHSRAPAREVWENPIAAVRRVMHQQQKRRAMGQSSAGGSSDSELAMAMGS